MKSSPDLRSCPAWLSQAKAKARSSALRSIGSEASALCSSTTANRLPSSARCSAESSLVIWSARGVGAFAGGSPTFV
jgi:hypothetical protein